MAIAIPSTGGLKGAPVEVGMTGSEPQRWPTAGVSRPALRVVLAEDDVEVRCLLAQALRKDGHWVVEVVNGLELLSMLQDIALRALEPPDLVVSDIRMPGKSGLDVLALLRENGFRTPFVLTTAFGDRATHAKALSLGALAVFDKPFDIDDLRTVVLNAGKLARE